MSENPGPASPGTPQHDDEQHDPPVDTGPGPNVADVNQDPAGTSSGASAGDDHDSAG